MKTTAAQFTIPASVFLGLLNGVEGMQISVMPQDVAPEDLMEMLVAATTHIQSLIDRNHAEPAPPEPDAPASASAPTEAPAETAVTLAPGESQTVTMPGGGTFTVNYPQVPNESSASDEEEPPLENQGE